MTRKELYEKAFEVVNQREQRAYLEQARHKQEINERIPEIERLQRQMNLVSIRLSKELLQHKEDAKAQMEQIVKEGEQANRKVWMLLETNGYPRNYLDPVFTCPDCRDTGYQHGEICHCIRDLVCQFSTEELNSTTTLQLCSFEDFDLSYYRDPSHPEYWERMRDSLNFCRKYAETFHPDSASLLMMGKTGLGKTHLSLSIAREVLNKGYQVVYGSAADFFQQIQNDYYNSKDSSDTQAKLLEADLLIMDDLGAEHEANVYPSILYSLVNGRLNLNKPTIVNTNLSLEQIEKRYTSRVLSRLATLYLPVRFFGKDIRQQKLSRH